MVSFEKFTKPIPLAALLTGLWLQKKIKMDSNKDLAFGIIGRLSILLLRNLPQAGFYKNSPDKLKKRRLRTLIKKNWIMPFIWADL